MAGAARLPGTSAAVWPLVSSTATPPASVIPDGSAKLPSTAVVARITTLPSSSPSGWPSRP